MGVAQLWQRYGNAVGQSQFILIYRAADMLCGNTGRCSGGEEICQSLGGECGDVAGLVFAEPEASLALDIKGEAGIACQGDFGQGHEQAAIGQIVAGFDGAIQDLGADEVAVGALGGQVDRGGGPSSRPRISRR